MKKSKVFVCFEMPNLSLHVSIHSPKKCKDHFHLKLHEKYPNEKNLKKKLVRRPNT